MMLDQGNLSSADPASATIDGSIAVNQAAGRGPLTFDWWKDWRGRTAAVIATGPSVRAADVAKLKGRIPVFAVKQAVIDLCPWADAVYGCDAPWWHQRGIPAKLKMLKLAWAKVVCTAETDIKPINLALFDGVQTGEKLNRVDRIMVDEPAFIGGGGNSGFQALNLAIQFGAKRIVLMGFDCQDRSGVHYYGRNTWSGANNPDEGGFQRWRRAFDKAVPTLKDLGVEVLNASPLSFIKAFPKATVDEVIERWQL